MTHTVAHVADIEPGTMLHVDVAGRAIALYNVDGAFYATGDICTHRRARLSDGYLDGTVVQCPLHFGKFDITNGLPLNPPCKVPIETYRVTRDGDLLLLDLEPATI
jgi:nitrite reductase/ring-hydroxylating ferredoxin subunit